MSFFGSLLLNSGVEKNDVEITGNKQKTKQSAWTPNNDGKIPEIIEVL